MDVSFAGKVASGKSSDQSAIYRWFCQEIFMEYERNRGEYTVTGRNNRSDRLRWSTIESYLFRIYSCKKCLPCNSEDAAAFCENSHWWRVGQEGEWLYNWNLSKESAAWRWNFPKTGKNRKRKWNNWKIYVTAVRKRPLFFFCMIIPASGFQANL